MAQAKIPEGQLDIGFADWFKPVAESPAGNQIDVGAGAFYNAGTATPVVKALQTTAAFTPVTVAGRYRYDLVYLDETGTVGIQQGAEQVTPVVPYTGAPGDAAGPTIDEKHFPVAWVLIDEAAPGPAVINDSEITDIRASFAHREGAVVGDLASDDGSGGGGVLGTVWKAVPADHQHPPNVASANPEDVLENGGGKAPGVSDVYSREDHVHEIDATAQANLATPSALSETLTFYPDNNPGNYVTYNLLQFQGRLFQNPGPTESNLWCSILPTAPLGVTFGAAIGPGGPDSLNPAAALDTWYYVYLISNGILFGLVYSSQAPSTGPDLSNPAFTGYTYWRFIGALVNGQAAAWEIVPARKRGFKVSYELRQLMYLQSGGSAPGNLSLATRLPPTAMRVELGLYIQGGDAGIGFIAARPGPGNMGLIDGGTGLPARPYSDADKLKANLLSTAGQQNSDSVVGFVDTDEDRVILISVNTLPVDSDWGVYVHGYEEFPDLQNTSYSW